RVDERQDDRAVRRIDMALNIDLVGQRARRANPLLLRRDTDDYVIRSGNKGTEIRAVEFAVRRQKAVGVRQADGSVIRVCEVEDRRQVTRYRTAPRGDISLEDSKALLDELNHRCVIEDLRIDVPPLAPRRDGNERYTLGEADRAVGV